MKTNDSINEGYNLVSDFISVCFLLAPFLIFFCYPKLVSDILSFSMVIGFCFFSFISMGYFKKKRNSNIEKGEMKDEKNR